MKTVKQLTADRKVIYDRMEKLDPFDNDDKKEYGRLKKQADFVTTCIRYLETKPDPDFIQKELDRMNNRISAIDKGVPVFNEGAPVDFVKKKVAEYKKLMGVSDIQNKARTLSFLLS